MILECLIIAIVGKELITMAVEDGVKDGMKNKVTSKKVIEPLRMPTDNELRSLLWLFAYLFVVGLLSLGAYVIFW